MNMEKINPIGPETLAHWAQFLFFCLKGKIQTESRGQRTLSSEKLLTSCVLQADVVGRGMDKAGELEERLVLFLE